MTREGFETYRRAFDNLVDCARGALPKARCAQAWIGDLGPLLPPAQARQAQGMTEYYVQDVLRANGGKSASCKAHRG